MEELLDESDEFLIVEPSLEEFIFELNKYPKIREWHFQGEPTHQENTPKSEENKLPERKFLHSKVKKDSSTYKISMIKDDLCLKKIVEEDEFSSNLLIRFLKEYLPEEKAKSVANRFSDMHEKFLNSLSIDSLERLAAKLEEF